MRARGSQEGVERELYNETSETAELHAGRIIETQMGRLGALEMVSNPWKELLGADGIGSGVEMEKKREKVV